MRFHPKADKSLTTAADTDLGDFFLLFLQHFHNTHLLPKPEICGPCLSLSVCLSLYESLSLFLPLYLSLSLNRFTQHTVNTTLAFSLTPSIYSCTNLLYLHPQYSPLMHFISKTLSLSLSLSPILPLLPFYLSPYLYFSPFCLSLSPSSLHDLLNPSLSTRRAFQFRFILPLSPSVYLPYFSPFSFIDAFDLSVRFFSSLLILPYLFFLPLSLSFSPSLSLSLSLSLSPPSVSHSVSSDRHQIPRCHQVIST